MKARNRKKEEEFKRQKQKHIQSAFYETTGSKSGGISSKQRRRSRYRNQQTSSSNISTSSITYKKRGASRNNLKKNSRHNNSLPYLKQESSYTNNNNNNNNNGISQQRMTQSYKMERNSSFPQRQPEQYGYETKLHDHEKYQDNVDVNNQREAWSKKLSQSIGSHFDNGNNLIENNADLYNNDSNNNNNNNNNNSKTIQINTVERTRMRLPTNLPVLRLGVPKFKSNSLVVIQRPNIVQKAIDMTMQKDENIDVNNNDQTNGTKTNSDVTLSENGKVIDNNEEMQTLENTEEERPKSRFIQNLNDRDISFFSELNVGPYDALERDMGKLGARGVKSKPVITLNDRLAGVMKDRTEKLAEQLLSSKQDEEDVKDRIRNNIIEQRRTLPLDFIFRRALKRYVKAHLEDGMKRWKSFIRRAQAVERLLKKVTPYAITIQRHMRGYLGRKRAAVMREIRRIELKRLRIKSATQLQVWWKLIVLLEKIRIRTAKNLAARQERSARKIQWCFRGHKSRSRVRRILRLELTQSMRDILKYEHMLTEEEHIMMEACSAVLFDQRDDPRWEREQLYSSLDIRRATKLCKQINESRLKRAKKKRDLNAKEIMREKQRMKRELLEKQKAKYEERLAKERERLVEIARREEEEKLRILRLKEEREREEQERLAKHRAMLEMENAHIREVMDQMTEEEKEQREAMENLKRIENNRIGKIKANENEKDAMAQARREAQLAAQQEKVIALQKSKLEADGKEAVVNEDVVDEKKTEEGKQENPEKHPEETENEIQVGEEGMEKEAEEGKKKDPTKKTRGGGDPWQVLGKSAYDAENQDELNINVGDVIRIIDRGDTSGDSDWWNAENLTTGAAGLFPSDCIEVVRKRVIGKENFVPEDDEELAFEEGDFIAIYEWNDPEWWKGENLTTKAVGMFPSNLVLTDDEFKERELLRKEEERKEEERQMELMADIAMEGIAVQDDEDGERALRVVFNLLDFNKNGTLERKDVVYSAFDASRVENILQACGKLRMWLRPSKINRFYRCIDHPLKDGHATYEQFKTFIKNPEVIEAQFFMEDNPPTSLIPTDKEGQEREEQKEKIDSDGSVLNTINIDDVVSNNGEIIGNDASILEEDKMDSAVDLIPTVNDK